MTLMIFYDIQAPLFSRTHHNAVDYVAPILFECVKLSIKVLWFDTNTGISEDVIPHNPSFLFQ